MHHKHFLAKWGITSIGMLAALALVSFALPAQAVDSIFTSTYEDANTDGTVERIRWVMDEPVTLCTYEAGDWTVNFPGSISVSVTGLSCTGLDANLDILVSADALETGGAVNPVISYSNADIDNSVTLASGAMTDKASVAAFDGAAPVVIDDAQYPSYNSGDAFTTIIGVDIKFTEPVTYAYDVSPFTDTINDWSVTANGLTGLTVAGLSDVTTDVVSLLVTASPNLTGVSGGTEPTISYTGAGAIQVVEVGGSGQPAVSSAVMTLLDAAAPFPISVGVEDNTSNDGKLDRVVITYSEDLVTNADTAADWAISSAANFSLLVEGTVPCNSGAAAANECVYNFTTTTVKTDLGDLTLAGDGDGLVIDDAGNGTGPMSFSALSTVPLLDWARPIVVSTTPMDGATGVSRTNSLSILFSEPMDGTFDYGVEYSLTTGADPGGWAATPSIDQKTILMPHNIFAAGTVFQLNLDETTIDAVAGSVTALNNVNGLDVIDFTTASAGGGGGGGTAPSIQTFTINNGALTTTSQQVTLDMLVNYASQMLLCNDAGFAGCTWEPYASTKSWTLTPGLGQKSVFARFRSSGGLDTSLQERKIELVSSTTTPPITPGQPAGAGAYVAPSGTNVNWTFGNIVKTSSSTAVYYVDTLGQRHAYPNQAVWESYFGTDFSRVRIISMTEMSAMPLGRNVPFNYGTLIKIPSVAKVYVVDGNATLRWITTEDLAKKYFGDNWATKVHDLSEAFFSDYTVGLPITE